MFVISILNIQIFYLKSIFCGFYYSKVEKTPGISYKKLLFIIIISPEEVKKKFIICSFIVTSNIIKKKRKISNSKLSQESKRNIHKE